MKTLDRRHRLPSGIYRRRIDRMRLRGESGFDSVVLLVVCFHADKTRTRKQVSEMREKREGKHKKKLERLIDFGKILKSLR